jgi:type III pantothenate kinase
MFIGIDIGNTRSLLGLYHDNFPVPFEYISVHTNRNIFRNELEMILTQKISEHSVTSGEVSGAAFSSVVPELHEDIKTLFTQGLNTDIIEINRECNLKITIDYDDPDQLGVDRIVNAEAAYIEYGGNTVVVDTGTAVTFCVIRGSRFEGGLIAPGIEISGKALHTETSRLPPVDFKKPERLVSKNTEDAIRSGLFYGWISMIEGVFSRIEQEYGEKFQLVITGGNARVLSGGINRMFILDEDLTMKGIKYIYEQNS